MSTPVSDPSAELARHALEPGTVVAERYRVEAKLGEGGMGAVYRAEHVHMRKTVALKVLHTDVNATPEAVARFEREAVAAGNIAHPNVAAATDFGQLPDGSFFLVLEYVDGKSVRALLNEESVDSTRALHIVHGIASALSAAHALGIVHRDLKPENVMLVARPTTLPNGAETRETVKVLDFGIAKVDVEGMSPSKRAANDGQEGKRSQPLTRIGAIFGTPDYMSPEQGLGQPVDARSDLYTIGIILYELLSGRRPFQGGTVTIIRQHVLDEVPPIAPEIAANVDPRVLGLVHRLLAKAPENRVQTAVNLCNEVETILTSGASVGPPAATIAADAMVISSPPPGTPGAQATPGPVAMMPTVLASPAVAAGPAGAPASLASSRPPPLMSGPANKPAPLALMVVGVAMFIGVLCAGAAVALHLRSSSTDSPGSTGSSDPADAEAAATVTSGSPDEATAPTSTKESTIEKSAAKAPPPPKAERGGKAEKKAAGRDVPKKGAGGAHNTGPGGIYIPPPNQWFK